MRNIEFSRKHLKITNHWLIHIKKLFLDLKHTQKHNKKKEMKVRTKRVVLKCVDLKPRSGSKLTTKNCESKILEENPDHIKALNPQSLNKKLTTLTITSICQGSVTE